MEKRLLILFSFDLLVWLFPAILFTRITLIYLPESHASYILIVAYIWMRVLLS